jgi:hypothetical protein
MMIILKNFCFAVKLSRSSRLDSKCLSSPTVFPPFVCVYVCVCVITNQFPRVLSAVSSVCVWSVGERERESWNSGWNPRSLLVSLLSANQIKQKRVRRTNCREQERVCDHIQQLFYIYVCVFVSQSFGYFHISFSQKNRKRIAERCGF